MGNKKDEISDNEVLIVIIIIVILLLYVISLGKIDGGLVSVPEEYKDSKDDAKRKHKRLTELLEKQQALKVKLEKKAKRAFLWVRIGLVLLWFSLMAALWYFNLITNLEDFLNYSEAGILLLITVNFLTFGTLTDLKEYINLLKTQTENWIFGKYVDIDERIESHEKELIKLNDEIS